MTRSEQRPHVWLRGDSENLCATPTRWSPGGLLVMSTTTRFTSSTSFVMRGTDRLKDLVREPAPVCGHRILAGHRAEHDGVAVRAAVALHADRADIGQQHYRELPDVAVEPGGRQFLLGQWHRPRRKTASRSSSDLADDPDG